MHSVALIVRLKPDSRDQAKELLDEGPPFDLVTLGFESHSVYLADDEAVFVFEGPHAERLVTTAAGELGRTVLGAWGAILDGPPRFAPGVFAWSRSDSPSPSEAL